MGEKSSVVGQVGLLAKNNGYSGKSLLPRR